MQNGNLNNITHDAEKEVNDTKIVKTDEGAIDGQTKCPKCGATEISLDIKTGKLRCEFCRHEFSPEKVNGLEDDVTKIEGSVVASGASDIVASATDILTLKCSSCGAEVVIDTASAPQARCHWCRNMLSINNQIPNGAIPDVILPFKITKEDAQSMIEGFVGKRKFFAHPKFKEEFTTENIMGVYFPYMVVDINSHAKLNGMGEHLVRRYTEKNGDNYETYYDADLYAIERDFDLAIHGLTVESNSDRLDSNASNKTNNIINSIMPFDIENCIKYDSNYLKGYTSEKRDANVSELKELVNLQAKDIARFAANESLGNYDRGVRWDNEDFQIKGEQWQAAYLPVWLYSYQEVKGGKSVLHYVAVNARTKETMGSVPIHIPKLLAVSSLVELLGVFIMLFIDWDYDFIFLALGFIFYFIIYLKYRNSDARHSYEKETKRDILNLVKRDSFIEKRRHMSNSRMIGANNEMITDSSVATKASKKILERSNGDSNGNE